jgi:hypothetical protein
MPYVFPRCQIVPQADHQVSFLIAGQERLRWHYGASYPRPFFYPLLGPSGHSLTRMGHPGAPNHDHHRSIWFAHHKVLGIDFWGDNTPARIRQKEWLCYQDGDEAVMAVKLGWNDGHDPKDLLEQELVVGVRPGLLAGETLIELQSTFRPTAEELEFGQTNFGFLAVRVAKSLSAYFGGGNLTGSTGDRGEPALFGKPAKWMDYSGPVPGDRFEGITFFDHPNNPGHPAGWHVREDGWMGPSGCRNAAITTTKTKPLVLRYLLWAHAGEHDATKCDGLFKDFSGSKAWVTRKSQKKHTFYEVERG